MTTVNVHVDYGANNPPSINFTSDGGPWNSTVGYSQSVTFNLTQASESSGFSFYGLTIWFGGMAETEPAETFVIQKGMQSAPIYNGVVVANIKVSASSVEFTVGNQCSVEQDLTLDVEILIQDPTTSVVYTSRDPQIRIEKPPG